MGGRSLSFLLRRRLRCGPAGARTDGLLCVGTVRRRSSHGCASVAWLHGWAHRAHSHGYSRLLCWLQHGRALRLSPVVSPMLARCSMAELHAAALADAKAELLALTAAHAALGEQAWHRPALHSGAFGATQRSA